MDRSTPAVTLKANRERSLRRHHPWVFSGAVGKVDGDPQPGDTVAVRSAGGEALGLAAYSPVSQIRARMWTFDETTVVDEQLIAGAHRRRGRAPQRRCSPWAPTRRGWCSARPTICRA